MAAEWGADARGVRWPRLLRTVALGGKDYMEADSYTLVSFTLQNLDQGNDSNQYLAVFTSAGEPLEFPAMEFCDGDALCCRSKPSKAIYSLNRLGLREIGADGGPFR